jgi:hypothetical protein
MMKRLEGSKGAAGLKWPHRTTRLALQQPLLHSIQLTPIEQPGMRPVLLLVTASFVSVVSARGGGGAPECVAHSVAAQLPLLRLPPRLLITPTHL